MNKYTFNYQGKQYVRISKQNAINSFVAGETVVIIPCKLRPFTMWHSEFSLNREDKQDFFIDDIGAKNYFLNTVNSIEYYNCNNETGKYVAFYKA